MSDAGQRIVVAGGPWLERIGCKGIVVEPPKDGTYPQPTRGEVIVLLDDDPLKLEAGFMGVALPDWWSCVIDQRHVADETG